ncbi:MAG: YlxR family protein [Clostridiales bacterium]|nr:YlxR family protein [Clostridiales bacterium]
MHKINSKPLLNDNVDVTKPVRMCCVCRRRHNKPDLIRLVTCALNFSDDNTEQKGVALKIDEKGNLGGRGAYICKNIDCINLAQQKRALNRAFKCNITNLDDIIDDLTQITIEP